MSPDVFVDGEALSEALDVVAAKEGERDLNDVLTEYQKIVAGKND